MTNKSFTLIEILVVIVVIGVLSAFILVGINSISSKANIAKGQAFANSVRNSLLINLVSEWKFENITDYDLGTKIIGSTLGNIPDSWGTNNGRAYNGPLLKEGDDCISGKCVYFDGINDYIDFGNNDSLNNVTEYAISFWVKTNQITATGTHIFWKENNPWKYIAIDLRVDNKIQFKLYDGTANPGVLSDIILNDNKYHQLLAMRRSGKIYLYRDTIANEAVDTTLSSYVTTQALTIGSGYGSGGSNPFNGYIDEINIYNSALSSSQIQQSYFLGLNKLFNNNGIGLDEYSQRLVELRSNISSID
jgi:prepilin-type N-terminal cleavage/methylation domain-containing protein